jgi:integrase
VPRPRTKATLLYWKRGRAYADFTGPEYAPWGGKLTALVPKGERFATTDPEAANILLAAHQERFRVLRGRYPQGLAAASDDALNRIAPFMGYHVGRLRKPKRNGRQASEAAVQAEQAKLTHAARFFAERRDKDRPAGIHYLREITPDDVVAFLDHIAENPPPALRPRRGGRVARSGGTHAKYLKALSRMLHRAWQKERIDFNPVDRLPAEERPTGGPSPTPFMEVSEAALALEAARRSVADRRVPYENYVRMATYLLTGGSGNDVEGLLKSDLDWRNELVWFRHNDTRQGVMKNRPERTVPFFPQLQEVMREYLASPHCPPGRQLFRGGDMGRWLDTVARSVGMPENFLRVRTFRVTWTTARAQTTDGGRPVAETTILQELGHRSSKMLREVYARVPRSRVRSEHVQYRWEDNASELGHRLPGGRDAPLTPNALAALRALRGSLTWKAWRECSGLGDGTFTYIRDRLVARGYVVVHGTGRGALHRRTPAGRAAAVALQAEAVADVVHAAPAMAKRPPDGEKRVNGAGSFGRGR